LVFTPQEGHRSILDVAGDSIHRVIAGRLLIHSDIEESGSHQSGTASNKRELIPQTKTIQRQSATPCGT
jgi:hypothetical protein